MIFKNNKVFDILKYIVLIAMPAVSTFLGLLGSTLNLEWMGTVIIIFNGAATLIGSLIGVSTVRYNAEKGVNQDESEQ